MKTTEGLYVQICSFSNLLLAAKNARMGKKKTSEMMKFQFRLENELIALQEVLEQQQYVPGKYREFYIHEPKKRMISAAPFKDRVVHHALCNVIGPILEADFIANSYANRKGKGTHKAIRRYKNYAKKYDYVLKCDIKKYFPCIDHEILKQIVCKKIDCPDTLALIACIIDNSNLQEEVYLCFPNDDLFTFSERKKGLPMGNLTSQFLANVYLNGLDKFVTEKKTNAYIRYVDDFVVFSNSKEELHKIEEEIRHFLLSLRLVLNHKTKIYQTREGVNFLGHKIYKHYSVLRKENVKRFKKRLKKRIKSWEEGKMRLDKLVEGWSSWVAHAKHAKTFFVRKEIFTEYCHLREAIEKSRFARWFLEQQQYQ